jgi:N-acetyl-anhydromuramyl-L-alanine amidase AmpD
MLNIKKYGKFPKFEKNKKKRQIVLCHSFRPAENFLNSLKYRKNGSYDKIPNYFITKEGNVLNLISDDSYTNYFDDQEVNRNSIIICLENLGWLQKTPLGLSYSNWIGDIYSKSIFQKKWKDKLYWEPYSEEQLNSLVELSKKLLVKFSIDNKFIGHNTKVDGVKLFNGIVCRSNYNSRYTDISPAFDYEKFKNLIENDER